jgi:hypothetical protein
MIYLKKRFYLITMISIILSEFVFAQAFSGYTLYGPNNSKSTYLIDMNNTRVHTWTHTKSGGYAAYLLADGSVLRTAAASNTSLMGGGTQGVVQRVSWSGTLLWEYTYSSSSYIAHHDIEPMPNGNVLILAWEVKTAAQCAAEGLNRNVSLYMDHIIEVQPSGSTGGTIVWQWHAWNHLIQDYNSAKNNYGVISEHPELLDINMGVSASTGGGDWMHVNSVEYDSAKDQIVFSSHTLDEIYVIDHSTTTAEAATHTGGKNGKGGDILYRWGNPSNYDMIGTTYFSVVHCATWVLPGCPGAGHILAFNNGYLNESSGTSSIIEINPPVDDTGSYIRDASSAFGPNSPDWTYTLASNAYSYHLGGCQRLPNGNTLVVSSIKGKLFEVDTNGTTVWSYSPGGEISRALRYPSNYVGLTPLIVNKVNSMTPTEFKLDQNYPNPFNPSTVISYQLPVTGNVTMKVYNILGKEVATLVNEIKQAGTYEVKFDASNLSSGIYFYRLQAGNYNETRKLILLK